MTRHLQTPYRIWPLEDLEQDNTMEPRKPGFSNSNLQTTLSISTCNNPQPISTLIKEMEPSKSRENSKVLTLHSEMKDREDTNTARSAMQAVIQTTELLEAILSHLPMVALYRFRRINKDWQSLISTSPTLRNNLWLTTRTHPIWPSRPSYPLTSLSFTTNPVLQNLRLITASKSTWDDCYDRYLFADITFPPRWQIEGSFWRKMQICDPPIQRVFLRSNWLEKYVECEEGVTVGILADLLEFQIGRLYFFHC